MDPAAPRSSRTRPAPRLPSKQVKANTLPLTNLRASSAFIIPANAGTTIAAAVTAPNTKRASMQQLQLTERGHPPCLSMTSAENQNPVFRIMQASLPAAYHTNRGDIE